MTAWRLAWALLRHCLRGRGRDGVYVRVVGDVLPPAVRDLLDRHNWAVTDVAWPAKADGRFLVVQAEPDRVATDG